MDLQAIINKAKELKVEGHSKEALSCYSDAFDLITDESDQYARNLEGSVVNIGKLRALTPKLFDEAKEYLKRDKVACTISNNMAVIFAELGDYESARKFFEQAIDLTPEDLNYSDPKIGLEELKK